jgi:hypothetical protein
MLLLRVEAGPAAHHQLLATGRVLVARVATVQMLQVKILAGAILPKVL